NVFQTTGWVLQALGMATRVLQWQLISAACFVVTCFIGVRWGAIGVAYATTIQAVLLILPGLFFSYRGTPLSVGGLFAAVKMPFLLAMCVLAISYWVHILAQDHSILVRIAEVLG